MRTTITIAGLLAVVAGLGAVKYAQISSLIGAAHAMEKQGPPPESVSTTVSREERWGATLHAVGNVAAAKGVTLSNDAAGIVTAIAFESGAMVRRGQLLVELDHSVERAQLASAAARHELASVTAGRSRTLTSSGVVPKTQLENDEAALKTSSADLDALQAQIARKAVRAPFSGRLGIRQVNLGQYLNPGTPVVDLQAVDSVFVDFTLPQQRLGSVKLGMPVQVTVAGSDDPALEGSISAIDPSVDPATRSIKLRATVPNTAEKLLPGMFAGVDVLMPQEQPVVAVPATAVVHASYGDSVFIAEERKADGSPAQPANPKVKVARQQFVRLGVVRGDFVAIVEGVKPGQEIVTAGAFKLRNGASILVNDDARVAPQLNPRPENR